MSTHMSAHMSARMTMHMSAHMPAHVSARMSATNVCTQVPAHDYTLLLTTLEDDFSGVNDLWVANILVFFLATY